MEVDGALEGTREGLEVVGVWEGVFDGEWEGLEEVGATEGTFPRVGVLEGVTLGKLVGEVVGKQVKIGPPFVWLLLL